MTDEKPMSSDDIIKMARDAITPVTRELERPVEENIRNLYKQEKKLLERASSNMVGKDLLKHPVSTFLKMANAADMSDLADKMSQADHNRTTQDSNVTIDERTLHNFVVDDVQKMTTVSQKDKDELTALDNKIVAARQMIDNMETNGQVAASKAALGLLDDHVASPEAARVGLQNAASLYRAGASGGAIMHEADPAQLQSPGSGGAKAAQAPAKEK